MYKQAFGNIIKKEQLKSCESLSHSELMLLEASKPFPGYDGQVSRKYYYLLLDGKKHLPLDAQIRLIQAIRIQLSVHIDICASEITLYNKFYQAFRICSGSPKIIDELVSHFMIYGLKFYKHQHIKPFISQIKVYKYFELEEIGTKVFKSINAPEFKYIQISDKLEWEEFELLVSSANQNDLFPGCDFALASLYSKEGIDDYIRVFSDKCTSEKVELFREFIYEILQKQLIK
jgi:hypothetical protein